MRYAFVLLYVVLAVVGAFGQDAPAITDDQVNSIARELYCPVCENIPLDVCGTAACDDWRYEIKLQLEQGMTADAIKADFVRRFGDRVVGTPYDPILRAVSLVTPFLLAGIALAFVGFTIWKARQAPKGHVLDAVAQTVPTTTASDDFRSRIEQDISR